MTPERWQQVKQVLAAALELDLPHARPISIAVMPPIDPCEATWNPWWHQNNG